jgi:hypothetical protein
MSKSPAHYRANPRKDAAHLRKGRATHSYILGDPSKMVIYEGTRNKKHKKYKEFLAQHPGISHEDIFSPSEAWDAKGMRMAIERHPEAMRLLEGHREEYFEWEVRRRAAAGTPDVWRSDHVIELKTDDCTEPGSFLRSAERYCYHAQLTWYRHGLAQRGWVAPDARLSIVAVESSSPYCVQIIHVTPAVAKKGAALWNGWLDRLAECEALDEWPGYCSEPVDWTLDQ